mmetsp:Transcript_23100/g.39504  ORF Transcript_23100/g.39504 Transcript_23100/m.39504 type:complete len:367 (-) Transcript_23100:403-1503(-)
MKLLGAPRKSVIYKLGRALLALLIIWITGLLLYMNIGLKRLFSDSTSVVPQPQQRMKIEKHGNFSHEGKSSLSLVSSRAESKLRIPSFKEMNELANSFHENGGIIFFLHMPKTGGSAVRSYLLDQMPNETNYIGSWKGKAIGYQRINYYLENGIPNKTVVVFEAHGGPPFLFYNQMSNQLGEWKQVAKENQVPFFAFTLVREPMSWYLSFYNYFITREGENITESDFFSRPGMKANMECAELAGITWGAVPTKHVSYSQCRDALALLKDQMDWVFTTDKLSTEMIPLISYLARFENRNLSVIQPGIYNHKKKKLLLSEFSEKGKGRLQNWTEWDSMLYEDIRESYDFSGWGNFLDTKGILHPILSN